MAKFPQCPNCGNKESGFTVYQCKNCSGHWCYKGGVFSSDGCGAASNKCPHCGNEKKVGLFSDSFRTAGYIEHDQ